VTDDCEMATDPSYSECAYPVSHVRYAGENTENDQIREDTREDAQGTTSRVLGRAFMSVSLSL
jgi:hypothetical protein